MRLSKMSWFSFLPLWIKLSTKMELWSWRKGGERSSTKRSLYNWSVFVISIDKLALKIRKKRNSKFQGLEIAQILKNRPNLDQKTLLKLNNYEKNQQKRWKGKRRLPSKTPSFFFFFRPLLSLLPTTIYIKEKKL